MGCSRCGGSSACAGCARCEACGLRWSEVDLDWGVLYIVRNRTTAGYRVVEGPPKTTAGARAVTLDKHTVQVRREHRHHQAAHRARRLAVGKMWRDSGYVSVRADGSPIHPGYASCPFRLLITMTPGWYPRGTHRPHPTDHKGWPSRKQQATRLMMLRARRDSNPQPSDP